MGNNPVTNVDPDGRFSFLTTVAIGAGVGALYSGIRAGISGGHIEDGIWRGALTGAFAAASVQAGHKNAPFSQLAAEGFGEGTMVGALDAALWGTDISKGMLYGGLAGIGLVAATSPQMRNAVHGHGFKSNDKVLADFVSKGQQQGALEYFGFDGTYDTGGLDIKYSSAKTYFGRADPDGTINYGDEAFRSYDNLNMTYTKEHFHQMRLLNGGWETQTLLEPGFSPDLRIYPEERLGFIHLYKNQGLFPTASQNIWGQLDYYQGQSFHLDPYRIFSQHWYDFIFRLPRRF